jgi:hypothetical protein
MSIESKKLARNKMMSSSYVFLIGLLFMGYQKIHSQELTDLLMENLAKRKVFLQAVLARMAGHTLVCGDYEISYDK